jgi:molecular chaperone GrpE
MNDAGAGDQCQPDVTASAGAKGSTDDAASMESTASRAAAVAVADLEARLAEAQDQRLRALADADNIRKRCATQVSRAAAETRAALAAEWLPVIDNLERALEHSQADPDAIIEGVRTVRDQAVGILAELGFPRRDDVGAKFDPARHEAIGVQTDPDAEPGTVLEVVGAGYGDGDHQLRPAQVVVAKAD